MEPTRLNVNEAKRMMDAGRRVVFLDTRSRDAWGKANAEIPGSIRIPPDDVGPYMSRIPHDATIITYCT